VSFTDQVTVVAQLPNVFGYSDDELSENQMGRLAGSQAERLRTLIAKSQRTKVVGALVSGCTVACFVGLPIAVIVVSAGVSPRSLLFPAVAVVVVVSIMSLVQRHRQISHALAELSAGAVTRSEGLIKLEGALALPTMKRGYRITLNRPELTSPLGPWNITKVQGDALVQGSRYRIYHTSSVIQSVEAVPMQDGDDARPGPPIERAG